MRAWAAAVSVGYQGVFISGSIPDGLPVCPCSGDTKIPEGKGSQESEPLQQPAQIIVAGLGFTL